MDLPTETAGTAEADFLLAFILTGDSGEVLPRHVCGVQLTTGRFFEDEREYLAACFQPSDVPESWFSPGFTALAVRIEAADRVEAVRKAAEIVRPAGSFLATYIRPPRQGLDLHMQRLVEPTGWVVVFHKGAWALVSYDTWALMTIDLPGEVGKTEANFNQGVFIRLVEASNRFWSENTRAEDRIRIERATTWYGRALSARDYATKLLQGWMAIVPLVIGPNQGSDLMLNRLQSLAARHGHAIERQFLDEIRRARNEIAHEASMANADPLAVDAAEISKYLHPLRLLFLMSLLFVMESEPVGRPLLEKWGSAADYHPSVLIDGSSAPFWYPVREIIGTLG